MTIPTISSYEVKTSRTEQKIPVINGVLLHSAYNPNKEAEAIVATHEEALKTKNEVLILGLGFAYHVNFIADKMQELHGDNYKIIVIEPNLDVYNDCIDLGLLKIKNVLVYTGKSAQELYSDIDLIHYLLRRPTVIAHPASFNLYQNYFKDFLTFEAPVKLTDVQNYLHVAEVKDYLNSFSQDLTLDQVLENEVARKTVFQNMDFLAMALSAMTKRSQELQKIATNGSGE